MNHQIISQFCTNPKTFYTQCHCRGVIGQKLKTLTWDRRFFSQWAQSGATQHVCCFTTLFCDANIVCWHTMGQTLCFDYGLMYVHWRPIAKEGNYLSGRKWVPIRKLLYTAGNWLSSSGHWAFLPCWYLGLSK